MKENNHLKSFRSSNKAHPPSPILQELSLLGACIAIGQTLEGVDKAPQAIRDKKIDEILAKQGWNVHDAGDIIIPEVVPNPFQPLPLMDPLQNLPIKNLDTAGAAMKRIAEATQAIALKKHFCLTLGGDHSVAIGSLLGLLHVYPDLRVVWVDAHGDINTPESSPSGNLHGMPLAALTGLFQLSQYPGFEYFTPLLKPKNLVLVGIRSLDAEERKTIETLGVQIFTMTEIDRYGIGPVMEAAIEAINPEGDAPMHLSFDIDAIDPMYAPATGTRVPGGLTYREAHYIAEAMAETNQLISMDIVEVNPDLAPEISNNMPDQTLDLAIGLIESALGKRIFPSFRPSTTPSTP
jgi:arginase